MQRDDDVAETDARLHLCDTHINIHTSVRACIYVSGRVFNCRPVRNWYWCGGHEREVEVSERERERERRSRKGGRLCLNEASCLSVSVLVYIQRNLQCE